jgi:hypothetical protein
LGGSSTSAALRRMVDYYRGTVVADEQDCQGNHDLTSSYVKVLNQGFQRGRPLIVCNTSSKTNEPQTFNVFCPKIVVTRKKFNDDALESRFITIKMRAKSRNDLPLNLPRTEFDQQALMLRNKLLKYRFDNYHKVKINPSLAVEGISDRLNQIGIPLLSTINDIEARENISRSLRTTHKELVEGWSNSIAGAIVRYIVNEWSNCKKPVYIQQIADHLNSAQRNSTQQNRHSISLELLGEQITTKKVGLILRDQLGLKTTHKRNGNVVLWNKRRLDELKRKYCI